jgi:hypothetical protein
VQFKDAAYEILEKGNGLIEIYEEKIKQVIPLRGRCPRVWEG